MILQELLSTCRCSTPITVVYGQEKRVGSALSLYTSLNIRWLSSEIILIEISNGKLSVEIKPSSYYENKFKQQQYNKMLRDYNNKGENNND